VRLAAPLAAIAKALLALALLPCGILRATELPRLDRSGPVPQLIVDGEPWIALGGEVHNSTASDMAWMAPLWGPFADAHLNTLVTPVYWELLEPSEGHYDFTLVDEQIRQAKQHSLHLVLLWFGTLKNASSGYAPGWVLADHARFPRAATRTTPGLLTKDEPVLSVFCRATLEADARAFTMLMRHLATTDPEHVVIALQVENETGLLGDSRDRSPAAERAWREPVPAQLMASLARRRGQLQPTLAALWQQHGERTSGSWSEVFGDDWQAEELFMAWAVGHYVDTVAAAGKAALALPMYANAWLGPQSAADRAGAYPSGGPVPRVFDIWKAAAPHVDWLSPDIYVDDFAGWSAAYALDGNPLFVPESRFIAGNVFTALGDRHALGIAVFGIEDGVPGNQLAEVYGLLRPLLPQIARSQRADGVRGFALAPQEVRELALGDYRIEVRGQREYLAQALRDMGIPLPANPPERVAQNHGTGMPELGDTRPAGLLMQLSRSEFLLVGRDLHIGFRLAKPPGERVEVARFEEGRYVDGQWVAGRVLNGDERLAVLPQDGYGMVRIRLLGR
jgi:beta-galactosidase GanA